MGASHIHLYDRQEDHFRQYLTAMESKPIRSTLDDQYFPKPFYAANARYTTKTAALVTSEADTNKKNTQKTKKTTQTIGEEMEMEIAGWRGAVSHAMLPFQMNSAALRAGGLQSRTQQAHSRGHGTAL